MNYTAATDIYEGYNNSKAYYEKNNILFAGNNRLYRYSNSGLYH